MKQRRAGAKVQVSKSRALERQKKLEYSNNCYHREFDIICGILQFGGSGEVVLCSKVSNMSLDPLNSISCERRERRQPHMLTSHNGTVVSVTPARSPLQYLLIKVCIKEEWGTPKAFIIHIHKGSYVRMCNSGYLMSDYPGHFSKYQAFWCHEKYCV